MLIWLIIYNNCWVMCAWEWLCCHESSFKLTVLEKQSNSYIVKIVSIFLTLLTLNFDLYLAHWKPSLFVEVNLCSSSFFCWNYSESSVQITRTRVPMYRSQANSDLSTLNADFRLRLCVYLDYQILLMVHTCICKNICFYILQILFLWCVIYAFYLSFII